MWHQIFSDVENAEIVAQISHVTNGVVKREQNEWTLTYSKNKHTTQASTLVPAIPQLRTQ